jgi:hypothetical protein
MAAPYGRLRDRHNPTVVLIGASTTDRLTGTAPTMAVDLILKDRRTLSNV